MGAYHALAESYDRLTNDVDYEATVDFYMQILQREGVKPRTVVDLACGTGSDELTLEDVETAAGIVQEAANPNANIIFGATSSPDFQDEMRVTVIATGFEKKPETVESAPAAKATVAPKGDISEIDEIFSIFNR